MSDSNCDTSAVVALEARVGTLPRTKKRRTYKKKGVPPTRRSGRGVVKEQSQHEYTSESQQLHHHFGLSDDERVIIRRSGSREGTVFQRPKDQSVMIRAQDVRRMGASFPFTTQGRRHRLW